MEQNATPRCTARRSDGVLCEDRQGHYGSHVWPVRARLGVDAEALLRLKRAYTDLRYAEMRQYGAQVDWRGRCGAEMNELMAAVEAIVR